MAKMRDRLSRALHPKGRNAVEDGKRPVSCSARKADRPGKKLATEPLRRPATGSMTVHERKGREGMRPGQNAPRIHTSTAPRAECRVTAAKQIRAGLDPAMTYPKAAKGSQSPPSHISGGLT